MAVLDRNYAAGTGGIFWQDTRAAFQGHRDDVLIQNYLTGLCGGDVTPAVIDEILADLASRREAGDPVWIGIETGREDPAMNATAALHKSDDCLLRPGNTNCGGCGMSVGLTMLGRALADAGDSCTLVIPACCGIVTAGAFPTTSYGCADDCDDVRLVAGCRFGCSEYPRSQ